MKIKYFLLAAAATCTMLFNACSDVLDRSPDGNITMEDVLADPLRVEALLNSCYRQIPTKGYLYFFYENVVVAQTDDAWTSEDTKGDINDYVYHENYNASYHALRDGYFDQQAMNSSFATGDWTNGLPDANNYHYWSRYWPQIRLCSQFIENIDRAAVRNPSDRARFKAEAHLLRAFYYMELVKWFGKVPILDATVPFDADFSLLVRNSVYEIAKFIEEDCNVAINTPELPWRITQENEALRVNKALAYALKSKIMLFAASPLFNEGENHWNEAYQLCKDAVTALKGNGYALFTQTTNPGLYGRYGDAAAYSQLVCENQDRTASPRDRETIYQHWTGGCWIWHIGYIGCGMSNTFKCGPCPTQELVDAYETKDGVPVLDLNQPYLDERHLQPNFNPANTLYQEQDPYLNRDPRFYASILYNECQILWERNEVWEVQTYVGGRHSIELNQEDRTHSRTGYYQLKMTTPDAHPGNQISCSNWKFYRLGELLLDYAEAACEVNQIAEAKAAVDEVRARVNMPPLPGGLTQDQMRLRIRNERRVELAWEEQRYFDLRRWQNPNGDLSATCKYLTGMWITRNANGSFTYSRVGITENPRGGWQNRDLLLPIPLAEASRLETVTGVNWQNPGW